MVFPTRWKSVFWNEAILLRQMIGDNKWAVDYL